MTSKKRNKKVAAKVAPKRREAGPEMVMDELNKSRWQLSYAGRSGQKVYPFVLDEKPTVRHMINLPGRALDFYAEATTAYIQVLQAPDAVDAKCALEYARNTLICAHELQYMIRGLYEEIEMLYELANRLGNDLSREDIVKLVRREGLYRALEASNNLHELLTKAGVKSNFVVLDPELEDLSGIPSPSANGGKK